MPVRRILKSFVLKTVEPSVREMVDAGVAARLAAMEEESASLKKKLSMAMGAIQAASAQIVQLRQEAEQAQNLAKQAMQRATTAQATAEAATEGVTQLETPTVALCSVEGCTSKAKVRGMCTKHAKQHANGTLTP